MRKVSGRFRALAADGSILPRPAAALGSCRRFEGPAAPAANALRFALRGPLLSRSRNAGRNRSLASRIPRSLTHLAVIKAQAFNNTDDGWRSAIMLTKTTITLAALLLAGTMSATMAAGSDSNAAHWAAGYDAGATVSPTLVVSHEPARPRHLRPRQSRDVGLRTGGYSPWGAPQAQELSPGNRDPLGLDGYDYYKDAHEACCL